MDSARLRTVLDSGSYTATADATDLAGFDIAVITVPTPLRDGVPDLTYIETCARTLGGHLRPGATVVLESTTYPGCTEELLVPILEKASGLRAGDDFLAGFSPERIAPGNKRFSFDGTPKVVSGIDAKSLDVMLVNISLVNELATLTAPLGVNLWEAIDAAATGVSSSATARPGSPSGGGPRTCRGFASSATLGPDTGTVVWNDARLSFSP